MKRLQSISLLCVWLAMANCAHAQESGAGLMVATGLVEKVEGESLTIRPRSVAGRFEKNLVLRLTGTSRLSTLSPRSRGGKFVLAQRKVEASDLQLNQGIAVIYANGSGGPVLLSGVVHPAGEK